MWERRTDHQLHTEAASKPFFYSFKLSFELSSYISTMSVNTRGAIEQATSRIVDIDRKKTVISLKKIAPVNFSVTWHVTSERVCSVK